MAACFNADEVLELAVDIERNGEAFYRKAAETVAEAEAKKLFISLANWEKQHAQAFSAMRDKYAAERLAQAELDPDGEASKYLAEIVDGKLFDAKAGAAELLGQAREPREILRLALEREKDTVLFYTALKELAAACGGEEEVASIIREEMSHVRIISAELRRLGT